MSSIVSVFLFTSGRLKRQVNEFMEMRGKLKLVEQVAGKMAQHVTETEREIRMEYERKMKRFVDHTHATITQRHMLLIAESWQRKRKKNAKRQRTRNARKKISKKNETKKLKRVLTFVESCVHTTWKSCSEWTLTRLQSKTSKLS